MAMVNETKGTVKPLQNHHYVTNKSKKIYSANGKYSKKQFGFR